MRKYWLLPLLLLASCAKTESIPQSKTQEAESASSSSLPPLPSDDHERIPLYQKGNVPYDGGDGERYAFLTPYLASDPTGGAIIVLPGGGYTHLSNSTPEEGSRFGGSNLAITAANTVIDTVAAEGIAENVESVGAYLREKLAELPSVVETRGLGLMVAVDLLDECDAHAITIAALDAGLLLNSTGPHTLRFLPPLVCTREDVDELVERLATLL